MFSQSARGRRRRRCWGRARSPISCAPRPRASFTARCSTPRSAWEPIPGWSPGSAMDSNLRKGWTEVVTGDDLDQHLAAIGQAQVNAQLLGEMLADSALPADAELLLAGVGTGQLFDYADVDALALYRLTCTDINAQFLAALDARLRKAPRLRASVKLDDLETTALGGPFDAVAAILLLEHIAWR